MSNKIKELEKFSLKIKIQSISAIVCLLNEYRKFEEIKMKWNKMKGWISIAKIIKEQGKKSNNNILLINNSRKLRYIRRMTAEITILKYGHAFIQATLYIIRIPLEETRPEGIIVFSVSLMLQPSTSLCLPTTQPCLSFSFSFSLLFFPFLFHFFLLFLLISPFFPLFFLFSFFSLLFFPIYFHRRSARLHW